jgi:hypothetical protein
VQVADNHQHLDVPVGDSSGGGRHWQSQWHTQSARIHLSISAGDCRDHDEKLGWEELVISRFGDLVIFD